MEFCRVSAVLLRWQQPCLDFVICPHKEGQICRNIEFWIF